MNDKKETPPTEEEIKQHRKDLMEWYEEQLPLLRKQEEYEKLTSLIQQHKANRIAALATMARFTNKEPEEKHPPSSDHVGDGK